MEKVPTTAGGEPGVTAAGGEPGSTVNVLNWPMYVENDDASSSVMLTSFTEATSIKVELSDRRVLDGKLIGATTSSARTQSSASASVTGRGLSVCVAKRIWSRASLTQSFDMINAPRRQV